MPAETRETRYTGCAIPMARISSQRQTIPNPTITNETSKDFPSNRNRGNGSSSCIPLPKTGQFASSNCEKTVDAKFAKTEKNRLTVMMRNNEERRDDDEENEDDDEDDGEDCGKTVDRFVEAKEKERRICVATRETLTSSRQPQQQACRTIPRYQGKYVDASARDDKKDEKTFRRQKHSCPLRSEGTTNVPSGVRVGVEATGTSSLLSWDPSIVGTSSTGGTRNPYHDDGDPPLGCSRERRRIPNDSQSLVKPSPPTGVATLRPRPSESRERCCAARIPQRKREDTEAEGHDMETNGKDDNESNSETPSPEPYARTSKSYDEDGSSEEDSKPEDGSQSHRLSSLYHGTWPVKRDLWTGQQMSHSGPQTGSAAAQHNDMASVMSFSSSTGMSSSSSGMHGHRRLGAKVDVVYSLLGMLGSTEGREDMSSTLLAMSNSLDSCVVMRQSGCLPLLVQLIHAPGQDSETRERAARALRNVVNARGDEKIGRREARVLRLLEQLRDYCQTLRSSLETERPPDDLERHPGPTIAALMKLSFDEAHRHAMCQLGGLHTVAELIEMDHAAHGPDSDDQSCVTLRRYAGMALTNLTFGDGNNKALLCSFRAFMRALVTQLRSISDDLRQVTASVLRNLSWRADSSSKQTLREVGAVTGLMRAAMEGRKESTLKSILSALWNLSAHCSTNKVDICAVEGALAFLVDMLSYKAPSKTLSIVENAGGILRNVSSHIAVRDDYRTIVRERDCLQVLLRQLRSPSLTVVSNACGALWNLSARCPHDQRLLWDLGAVPMLRSLVHSKHKMISMGSSAALKNLLTARPAGSNLVHLDSTARGLGLSALPSLVARRQRALEQEIDQNLSETCENIEPSTSPTNRDDKFGFKVDQTFADVAGRGRSFQIHGNHGIGSGSRYNGSGTVARSDSRESVRSITSTHSDTIFERVNRNANNGLTIDELQAKQQSSSLHSAIGFNVQPIVENSNTSNRSETKYALRYKNSIPKRLRPTDLVVNEIAELRCTTSTMSWATGPDQESACSQISMQSSDENSTSPVLPNTFSVRVERSKIDDDSPIVRKISSIRSPIGNAIFSTVDSEETTIVDREETNKREIGSSDENHDSDGDIFEVYAETDIDRPTNYSLRYAERNSDEDDKQSSGYFAGSEQETEDTVKTYCTEGTPYETPLCSSGAASDNDFPDGARIGRASVKNHLGRINDGSRDVRRDFYVREKSSITDSSVTMRNVEISSGNVDENVSSLPNSLEIHSDVDKSSESLADSGLAIAERSQCDSETLKSSLNFDSACSIEATVARINNLVITDEPKITNDSRNKELALGERRIDAENFPETMISDGDEDDEDLLAACIHIGMQNNRHRQSFRRNSLEKTPPEESNLARYQTSTALDQVEDTEFADQTERPTQSETPRFNIKITTDETNEHPHSTNAPQNDYSSFEDNFNIAQDDDKITVEYQKLQKYCSSSKSSEIDSPNSRKSAETKRESRSNSVEDNLIVDDISPTERNFETRDSESLESYDSVERSERALLQLCITSKNSEKNSPTVDSVKRSFGEVDEKITETTLIRLTDDDKSRHVEDEYRRRRDPDAMIASLDRLTATLVQQTEAMRERESSSMKQSVLSDTWNEDSPNDVSYPSISVSAPLIASFKSEDDDENATAPTVTFSDRENVDASAMTNSRIIEREARRLAEAVSAEGTRQQRRNDDFEAVSLNSNDLEAIKPPSQMNSLISLTASYVGNFDNQENSIPTDRCHSTSISPVRNPKYPFDGQRNPRKKSLPVGVVAKRALAQLSSHAGSLESLLNDSSIGTTSQLENVKPPSMMDEIFDNGDMENSMLSVASITSEIADSKDHDTNSVTGSDSVFDLLKPVANVLSLTCMRYAESMENSGNDSLTEYLENINPPSLFNEVSEMDDSTMEANTETLCSDTLCIDVDLKTDEIRRSVQSSKIEEAENDSDEALTPLQTESCYTSSAESTPKKRLNKNHLTPKQKRQLAKERYKTYTIAAELVKKEEEERKKLENSDVETKKMSIGKSSKFSKLTPKQRRQEDRARFQTQVLENPFPNISAITKNSVDVNSTEKIENSTFLPTTMKSSIPQFSNLCGGRTFRKKRSDFTETDDRYRTITLNDVEPFAIVDSSSEISGEALPEIDRQQIHEMLEQNANIVLHTLNETSKRVNDAIVDDVNLDCETLSLVSNDSESEQSLRLRFASGLSKKLLTSYVERAADERANKPRETDFPTEIEDADRRETFRSDEAPPEVSDSESDDEDRRVEEPPIEPKRPRITKPNAETIRDRSDESNVREKSEPGSPKPVRGRRKALYSSPNTRKPTPQSSPIKQSVASGIPVGRGNTSPIVRATRATTLRQNTNNSVNVAKETKSIVAAKNSPPSNSEKRARSAILAKRSSIPQRGSVGVAATKTVKRHSTPPGCTTPVNNAPKSDNSSPKPLERQGTFTKDEPEVENAPTVVCSSPGKSKIAKPTKGSPIRTIPATVKSKISVRTNQTSQQPTQSKLTKCSSVEKMQSPRISPSLGGIKKFSTPESVISGRNDPTNGQTEIPKIPRRTVSLGQRSNSNSSITSTSGIPSTRKMPKEATSKIASLWKKVEDSRNKQKYEKPDTRQWITAPTDVDATVDRDELPVASKPPVFRLFRSSTFEGVPQETGSVATMTTTTTTTTTTTEQRRNRIYGPDPSKYRNSCDLTGMTSADAPCKIPMKSTDGGTKNVRETSTGIGYGTIVLRKQRSVVDSTAVTTETEVAKRISRLGSFVRVDSSETESARSTVVEDPTKCTISAMTFYADSRPETTAATMTLPNDDDDDVVYDFQTDIVTGSSRVTSV